MRWFFLSFSLLCPLICFSEDKAQEPPKKGNFAVSSSQQPGAFISIGDNVIDKNQIQLFVFTDGYKGFGKEFVDIIPAVLYGVAENFSLFINVPLAQSYRQDLTHSSGLEDIFIQPNYAFYNNSTNEYVDQATVLVNFNFPTGSKEKQPPTGFGAASYFAGLTYNRTYVDWYIFTSGGALLTTNDNSTKYGNQYLYQLGLGKNITYVPSKWIFNWLAEVDGTYYEKDKINGVQNPNSGGNVIYVTPSLWVSTEKIILQAGVGWPVLQDLFGIQNKEKYVIATNLAITFG